MAANAGNRQWRYLGLAAALLLLASTLWAAEGRARPKKIGVYNPQDQTVEMFAAIEKGDIAVKLIPKNSTQSRVFIENKTSKPLNVKLPEAFAGVPALAQVGGGGGHGGGSSSGSSSSNQSVGGGMGGGGMMGGGMGMFNVPPEQVGQLKVTTVCLEHGKAEPREQIPYEIRTIESVTTKSGVRELCTLLGSGQINQRAAQVAAWHLNNGMSWQELAAKTIDHLNGSREPYFSPQEIQGGMKIVATAVRLAQEQKKQNSGTTGSLGE